MPRLFNFANRRPQPTTKSFTCCPAAKSYAAAEGFSERVAHVVVRSVVPQFPEGIHHPLGRRELMVTLRAPHHVAGKPTDQTPTRLAADRPSIENIELKATLRTDQ